MKALKTIEQREPSRPFEHVDVAWSPERMGQGMRDHQALVGDYKLLVVEVLDEEFLATEPPDAPRISWSVYRGKDKDYEEALVGAPAPTIVVGKARAEALWRAFMGYKRA